MSMFKPKIRRPALAVRKVDWTAFLAPSVLVLAALLAALPVRGETLIDPTRPANAPRAVSTGGEVVEVQARVTAVFVAGGRRVAVLDGRVVKAGDRFGDIVVQEVLADGVRYLRSGRSEVVRLPRQDARVRHSAGGEESNP
ncbi:MAG TPA: hypothetical protein VK629_01735 [Steroidobacteraceae bacterium]|nr:hypothetical protein [Steroidobacteraceae bacterium]